MDEWVTRIRQLHEADWDTPVDVDGNPINLFAALAEEREGAK